MPKFIPNKIVVELLSHYFQSSVGDNLLGTIYSIQQNLIDFGEKGFYLNENNEIHSELCQLMLQYGWPIPKNNVMSGEHNQPIIDLNHVQVESFIGNGFLKIDLFLQWVDNVSKSVGRRESVRLLRIIRNWQKTFYNNTTVSYRRLIQTLKYFEINTNELSIYLQDRVAHASKYKGKDWEPQMYQSVSNFNKALNVVASVDTFMKDPIKMERIERGINNVDNILNKVDSITDFLDKLTGKLSQIFEISEVDKFVATINKIFLFLMSIYYHSEYAIRVSSFYNMVAGLVPVTRIAELFGQLAYGLSRASKGVLGSFTAQMSTDFDSNFVTTLCTVIGQTMCGMFSPISGKSFEHYSINVKKILTLAGMLRACSTIFEYIVVIIEFVFSHVVHFITKKVSFVPDSLVPDTVKDLYAELKSIEDNDLITQSMINTSAANKIISFRNRVNEFLLKGNSKHVNKLLMVHVNYIKRSADKWVDAIPTYLKNLPGSDREKPIWLYVYGAPRIGKTTIVAKALVYACSKRMNLITNVDKWDAFVFNRNLGEPYWEGYNNHPVVSYTDIFQEIADEQKIDLSITELTRVNDGNAYLLPMAFEGKGKKFFTSKLIVSDAQDDITASNVTNRCWSKGEHIKARRTFVVEVLLNEKYKNLAGHIDYDKYNAAFESGNFLNTSDCPVIPRDAYIINLRDNLNSRVVLKTFTDFNEAVLYISNESAKIYGKEQLYSDAVVDYCNRLFKPQMDDINTSSTTLEHTLFFDAKDCFCFDPESMIIYKEMYGYPMEPHICFNSVDEMHKYYGKHQEGSRFNKQLRIMIGELNKVFLAVQNRVKLAKEELKKFTIANPIFVMLGVAGSLLSLYKFAFGGGPKDDVEAQTTEMRERHVKVKRARTLKKIDVEPQMANSQLTETMTTIKNSMCRIVLVLGNNGKYKTICGQSALNIGGDVFVLPKHYWLRLQQFMNEDVDVQLILYWPSRKDKKCTKIDIRRAIEYPDEKMWTHAEDLIYIKFPNLCCGRDLRNKFISIDDNPNLVAACLFGIRGQEHICDEYCNKVYEGDKMVIETLPLALTRIVGSALSVNPKYINAPLDYTVDDYVNRELGTKVGKLDINLQNYYKYDQCGTMGGDCGMLLMHKDIKVVPKLMGMHVAGSVQYKQGTSCAIFAEDITDVLDYFTTTVKLSSSDYVIEEYPKGGFGAQASTLDIDVVGRLGSYLNRKGQLVSYKVNMPNKTKISKSVVYDLMADDFGKSKMAPAKLNKETIDGVEYSPMLQGLNKLTQYTQIIEGEIFDKIVRHVSETVGSWDSEWSRTNNKRVLTMEEAINGINGLRQLDMSTSAGFPFVKLSPQTNKLPWVHTEQLSDGSYYYTPLPDLIRACTERVNYARRGQIVPTYFVNTLKDETRLIEKVNSFKTRVFQVGPFDLSIVIRQYCGQFMAHCQGTPIVGEMGIGINPESLGWTFLLRRLQEVGNNYICGDYSNYDASISYQFSDLISTVINDFYNDTSDNKRIRKVLVSTLFSSDQLVDTLVFEFKQGNPSGNALTTIVNCLVNMGLMRYVYMLTVEPSLITFHDNVRCTFYGDDNLLCVSDSVKSKFNMKSIEKVLLDLGFIYTSTTKENITYECVPLRDVSYLQRKFVKHEKFNFFLAPLNYDTIMEIARWSQGDPLNSIDQMARFNSSLMSMAAYGEVEFNKLRNNFVEYCYLLSRGNLTVDGVVVHMDCKPTLLFDYNKCMAIMYPEYFKSSVDLIGVYGGGHPILQGLSSD